MKIFDVHCDAVIKVMDGLLAFEAGEGEGQLCLLGMISASEKLGGRPLLLVFPPLHGDPACNDAHRGVAQSREPRHFL